MGIIGSFVLTACSPDVPPALDREALYNRFHGQYEVVSSQSSEPVDLDLDMSGTERQLRALEKAPVGACDGRAHR